MMNYYEVALVKSARSATGLLTYHFPKKLPIGTVVRLKVRKLDEIGVVIKSVTKPEFKTKPIDEAMNIRIDKKLLTLASWVSQYYQAPIGACVRFLVPSGLQIKRRPTNEDAQPVATKNESDNEKLTQEQTVALQKLSKNTNTSLLHGVTGSGKTRVYIEYAKQVIVSNRSVIVLVPEISLTTQLVGQMRKHFENVIVAHSNMTQSERHKAWTSIYEAREPMVVVGPRSALFMPVNNLGLVVVDECHDDSYKQTNAPRYNTLKVARKLCDLNKAKLILGSATPAIVDYYLADERGSVIKLNQPVKSVAGRQVSLIDMKAQSNNKSLGQEALDKISEALKNNEQALIYHNRRGTSPLVICSNCAWTAKCSNCHIPMVLHQDKSLLKCHNCGRAQKLPTSCPQCSNTDIVYRGIGTKKIEQELNQLFPEAAIARFDTDNKKVDSLAKRYDDVHSGEIDIIVGTQMIAKGLDLPKLNTGIVVLADTGLNIPDFSANEKVFQLLHQVIGRVGRHSKKSYVGIQTFTPKNRVIGLAVKQDYDGFYKWALEERKTGAYPPFKHLLLLTCSYATQSAAQQAAQKALDKIKTVAKVETIGPAPSLYEKLGNQYRWQILVKASSRKNLVVVAEHFLNKPKWTINLDPVSLL